MAFFSRLRQITHLHSLRHYSILSPDSKTPLSSYQKTRAALSLLKSESNPEKILDICRAASLTPSSHLDRVAFSLAISKLSKSNYFEGIRSFIEELKTRPDLRNERFVSHAIVLYGQAGMLDNAMRSFKEIPELGIPRSVKSLNALLFSCIVAKEYKEVGRVFKEFPKSYGIELDLDSYNHVIKAFCESGSSNSVYSILAEMERKGVKPNTTSYGTLIAGFSKEEKFDDVTKVLKMMKENGVPNGLSIYNIRIKSLCKLGKSSEAKELLDRMWSNGMKANSNTYCELIHGFCRENNYEEAKKLFKMMVNNGCAPGSDCYFTLVHYLCKSGDIETAFEICKESMEKNWVPNFGSMKTLVNGLVSIGKVGEAKELIGQVKEKFPKMVDLWNEVEATLPQ